jgi:hypothetical protein
MGRGCWRGEVAATPSWGMAMAALPMFGQTRFVCFLTTGNVVVVVVDPGGSVVVVVVDPGGSVVVVVVGEVVVVVDPVGSVVVVDVVDAFAGIEVRSGLAARPTRTRVRTDAHDFHLGEEGFTNSIYWVRQAIWERQG